MKKIKLGNITLSLLSEDYNVRIRLGKEDILFANQNVDTVAVLVENNFNVVINHYKLMIDKGQKEFNFEDISFVSISIVLYYLYMYNSWRTLYKKQENKDLKFYEKDFSNPSTYDIVFNYFKAKYSNDWEAKCAVLLGMKLDELKAYYKTRENFYNK